MNMNMNLNQCFRYNKRFIGLHLIQHPAQRAHTKQYYWYLVRCNELDVGLSLVQYVFNIFKKNAQMFENSNMA